MSLTLWRTGSKVPLNVYEGDRPICQCHTAIDAQRIAQAVNSHIYHRQSLEAQKKGADAEISELRRMLAEVARQLIADGYTHGIPVSAINIAHLLGYDGDLTFDELETFLSSVSREESVA